MYRNFYLLLICLEFEADRMKNNHMYNIFKFSNI